MWFLIGCGVWIVLAGLVLVFNYAAASASKYEPEPPSLRRVA